MRAKPIAGGHTADILDGLASHIDKVLDAYDAFGRRTRWTASHDSPLQDERVRLQRKMGSSGVWDGKEAGQAGEMSALFGQLAAQHLEAVRVLLISREVIFSLAPLCRSTLEVAGHVFWLLDTRLHGQPRDRAARVFLSRLDDATRRVTAAKPVGHPHLETFLRSVHDLREEFLPAHFYKSEIVNQDGRITLRGQSSPGLAASLRYIEAVTGVDWNTSAMYAYLSNASHPSLHVVLDGYVYDEAEQKGQFVAKDARLPYLLTRAALMSFIRIWQVSAAYHGLDYGEAGDLGEEIDALPSPEDD